jgi:cysteine desulfurase
VLDAMGVAPAEAESAIRVSLGWTSSEADIDQLVEAWGALYARTRASAA